MYVGTQLGADSLATLGDAYLAQLAQLGVRHACIDPPGEPASWTRDDLLRHVERVNRHDLELDMIQLPLSSLPIERSQSPHIMLGQSPERDREIDVICRILELLANVGIGAAKYNLNIIGIPRTAIEIGRGGSRHEAFRLDQATDGDVLTRAGHVDEDQLWERVDYFLARVVPVAESLGIRLACHPHDPCTPPGYRGVTRVLGTVDGLKRFVTMHESPAHGLNFCQGTVAESLENPRAEIGDVIRWFGERGKLMNVHFRNISGGRYSFREEFPDNGDMDMIESFRLYRDVGYQYMLMPDHVPVIDGAAPFETAFAFCFGYIIALFQANGMDPYGRAIG
jgi:mannonate dehydratase